MDKSGSRDEVLLLRLATVRLMTSVVAAHGRHGIVYLVQKQPEVERDREQHMVVYRLVVLLGAEASQLEVWTHGTFCPLLDPDPLLSSLVQMLPTINLIGHTLPSDADEAVESAGTCG